VPSSVLPEYEISASVPNDTGAWNGLQADELLQLTEGHLQHADGGGSRMSEDEGGSATEELTSDQKRDNVIRLAFGGSEGRFNEFVNVVREAVPPGTGVVLRGSAVTGERWKDGAAFDADGPGTSDLDLTLVGGDEIIGLYKVTGFWVPGLHSRPLSDVDPDIAPTLVPLRKRLMGMVKRPVNIQGSREVVMYVRGELGGQPYLVLIEKSEDA
jgi:hypothetical protein